MYLCNIQNYCKYLALFVLNHCIVFSLCRPLMGDKHILSYLILSYLILSYFIFLKIIMQYLTSNIPRPIISNSRHNHKFIYIVVVSFIGGGNQSTRRKPF